MIGIIATDKEGGIGLNGQIPWFSSSESLKEDLKRFKKITTYSPYNNKKNVVIMGRKTYESIGKALPGRINIVMSKSKKIEGLNVCKSKEEVKTYLKINTAQINKIYIIGGKEIYETFHKDITKMELTIINAKFKCDTQINLQEIYKEFRLINIDQRKEYCNLTMERV